MTNDFRIIQELMTLGLFKIYLWTIGEASVLGRTMVNYILVNIRYLLWRLT
jgi:hypothetical protein